ncbi:hypothetical protein [Teichococcus oryzae]|uniref:hypothetical protein n=1 Tax=Teichococcus oryzae TaxID=1608942 RepID=UPI001375CC36|nr:hypothetical protein [Pseudoroseomonas oryzae]
MIGLVMLVSIVASTTPSSSEVEACNRAVSTLLTTQNPIELQRISIVLDHMNCNVAKRF